MDIIYIILKLVIFNCWMVFLDLKDVYYSVKIYFDFQKYFKFIFDGLFYKYIVFFNGLFICFCKFIKMMKLLLLYLRFLNYIISGYIDDFYLQGSIYQRCVINVIDFIRMFDDFGFVVYLEKFVFIL